MIGRVGDKCTTTLEHAALRRRELALLHVVAQHHVIVLEVALPEHVVLVAHVRHCIEDCKELARLVGVTARHDQTLTGDSVAFGSAHCGAANA